MEFKSLKVYWCIDPNIKWNEDLPVVKPWQGKLFIRKGSWGGCGAWYMYPVDSPNLCIQISSKDYLFHTERAALWTYIEAEHNRLEKILDELRKEADTLSEVIDKYNAME